MQALVKRYSIWDLNAKSEMHLREWGGGDSGRNEKRDEGR